jgi:hypothetical protein
VGLTGHLRGTVRKLADQQHLGEERAEALMAAWEAEAAARGPRALLDGFLD